MTKVTLVCPNLQCKAALEVAETLRGQRIQCTRCGQIIQVPEKKRPVDKRK